MVQSHQQALDETFCLAVIEYGGNLGAAYQAAYGEDVHPMPHAAGRQELNRPEIAKRVLELQENLSEGQLISRATHIDELGRIRDLGKKQGNLKVALEAEVSRGKAAGLYIEKREIQQTQRVILEMNGERTPVSVNEWAKLQNQVPLISDVVDGGIKITSDSLDQDVKITSDSQDEDAKILSE